MKILHPLSVQDFYVHIVVLYLLSVELFGLCFRPSCFPIAFSNRWLSSQKHFCHLSKTLLIAGTNAFESSRNTSECTPLYYQSISVASSKHAPCIIKTTLFHLFGLSIPFLPISLLPPVISIFPSSSRPFPPPFPVFPTAPISSRRSHHSHFSHDSPFSCLFIFFP